MSIIRDHLFFAIDKLLPRKLAAYPYQVAYQSLVISFLADKRGKIWLRNSIEKGNFIFGVSDLDLTILTTSRPTPRELFSILDALENQKRIYPFIGETNFLQLDKLELFYKTINRFERMRDPELEKYLPELFISEEDLKIERAVFLLRMYDADFLKLNRFPHLRQKKWRTHFKDLGLHSHHVSSSDVVKEIAGLIDIEEELLIDVLRPLSQMHLNGEDIFKLPVHKLWKYLFPHKYLWFHHGDDDLVAQMKDSPLAKLCLRQIDWEIWGLMTQIPYLKNDIAGLQMHLDRLQKVTRLLSDSSHAPELMDELMRLAR